MRLLNQGVRLVGLRLLIVTVSAALICTVTEQQVSEPRKPLTLDLIETATIVVAPTTIGSADSELYWRSPEDIEKTLDALQAMGVNRFASASPGSTFNRSRAMLLGPVDSMVNAANQTANSAAGSEQNSAALSS